MPETAIPEIKREKVFIPAEMSISDVQKKYSFSRQKSRIAKKKVSLLRIIFGNR